MRYIKLLIVIAILLTFTVNMAAQTNEVADIIKSTKTKQVPEKSIELINNSTNIQETIATILYSVNKNKPMNCFSKTVTSIVSSYPDQAVFTTKEAVKLNKSKKFNTKMVNDVIEIVPEKKQDILVELQSIPHVNVDFGKDAYGNPAPEVSLHQIAPVNQGTVPYQRRYPAKFYTGK